MVLIFHPELFRWCRIGILPTGRFDIGRDSNLEDFLSQLFAFLADYYICLTHRVNIREKNLLDH